MIRTIHPIGSPLNSLNDRELHGIKRPETMTRPIRLQECDSLLLFLFAKRSETKNILVNIAHQPLHRHSIALLLNFLRAHLFRKGRMTLNDREIRNQTDCLIIKGVINIPTAVGTRFIMVSLDQRTPVSTRSRPSGMASFPAHWCRKSNWSRLQTRSSRRSLMVSAMDPLIVERRSRTSSKEASGASSSVASEGVRSADRLLTRNSTKSRTSRSVSAGRRSSSRTMSCFSVSSLIASVRIFWDTSPSPIHDSCPNDARRRGRPSGTE